jgi:hypothetical protein
MSAGKQAGLNGAQGLDDLAALGKKVEARMPGVRKILADMRDSDDPDRIADGAYLLGTLDEIGDYVALLREITGV